MKYLHPFIILVGIALGLLFPYYALSLSRWAFIFLLILLSINLFPVQLNLKSTLRLNRTDIYFIFFSYMFIPALMYILTTSLHVNHSLQLGFFITSLAPLAIITPQFISDNKEKLIGLKHIVLSTLIFPFYFSLMLYLFFPKMVKFNIISIIRDSLILTLLPFLLVFLINSFFHSQKLRVLKKFNLILPALNMLNLGVLCFIFVGSTYLKNDLTRITSFDWVAVVSLAVLQDFGVYFLAKFFNFKKTFQIIISMKNVAFIGTFGLIFFPKILLPVIAVLFIHVFLIIFHSFNFLPKQHSAS